jgi:small conductance mechanosensitive channel
MPDAAQTDQLAAFLQQSGLRLLVAVVLAFLAFSAARPLVHRGVVGLIARRRTDDELEQLQLEDTRKRVETVENLISRMLRLLVLVVLVLVVMSILDLLPAIAGLGLLAAALTVAGQDVVRDYLMGVLILVEGQYSEGDIVQIGGVEGTVELVGLRRTVLRDLSGTVHSVSNGNVRVSSNLTRFYARAIVDVTVAFGTDLERVTEIVDDVGRTMLEDADWGPKLLEPPSLIRVGSFTELGVPLRIGGRVRAADRFDVSGELRKRILVALQTNDVDIPGVHRLVPAGGRMGGGGPGASRGGPGAPTIASASASTGPANGAAAPSPGGPLEGAADPKGPDDLERGLG